MVVELLLRQERAVGASSHRRRKKILVFQHLLWRLLRVFDRFLGIRIRKRIEFGK